MDHFIYMLQGGFCFSHMFLQMCEIKLFLCCVPSDVIKSYFTVNVIMCDEFQVGGLCSLMCAPIVST